MAKRITQSADSALPQSTAAYDAAFLAGARYAMRYITEHHTLTPRPTQLQSIAAALRQADHRNPRKAQGRKRHFQRMAEDLELAHKFADLIESGKSSKEARDVLGIGVARGKRVSALAAESGFIDSRLKRRNGMG